MVLVEDQDPGGKLEEVDLLVVSKPTGIRPAARFTSAEEVRGNAGRGFLRFNFRLICTNNYTGDDCAESPCAAELCSGSECYT